MESQNSLLPGSSDFEDNQVVEELCITKADVDDDEEKKSVFGPALCNWPLFPEQLQV